MINIAPQYVLKCSSINGCFARYLRCSEILIPKIRECILRLKFYSALISNKLSYLLMGTSNFLVFL
jgi:hypothetical protein